MTALVPHSGHKVQLLPKPIHVDGEPSGNYRDMVRREGYKVMFGQSVVSQVTARVELLTREPVSHLTPDMSLSIHSIY